MSTAFSTAVCAYLKQCKLRCDAKARRNYICL